MALNPSAIKALFNDAEHIVVYGYKRFDFYNNIDQMIEIMGNKVGSYASWTKRSNKLNRTGPVNWNEGTRSDRDSSGVRRRCKITITELVLENYKRSKEGKSIIPLLFFVGKDSEEWFVDKNPQQIISKNRNIKAIASKEHTPNSLYTHAELRRCYKLCGEMPEEIKKIAKETLRFVKLVKAGNDEYNLEEVQPFWNDREWENTWKVRKPQPTTDDSIWKRKFMEEVKKFNLNFNNFNFIELENDELTPDLYDNLKKEQKNFVFKRVKLKNFTEFNDDIFTKIHGTITFDNCTITPEVIGKLVNSEYRMNNVTLKGFKEFDGAFIEKIQGTITIDNCELTLEFLSKIQGKQLVITNCTITPEIWTALKDNENIKLQGPLQMSMIANKILEQSKINDVALSEAINDITKYPRIYIQTFKDILITQACEKFADEKNPDNRLRLKNFILFLLEQVKLDEKSAEGMPTLGERLFIKVMDQNLIFDDDALEIATKIRDKISSLAYKVDEWKPRELQFSHFEERLNLEKVSSLLVSHVNKKEDDGYSFKFATEKEAMECFNIVNKLLGMNMLAVGKTFTLTTENLQTIQGKSNLSKSLITGASGYVSQGYTVGKGMEINILADIDRNISAKTKLPQNEEESEKYKQITDNPSLLSSAHVIAKKGSRYIFRSESEGLAQKLPLQDAKKLAVKGQIFMLTSKDLTELKILDTVNNKLNEKQEELAKACIKEQIKNKTTKTITSVLKDYDGKTLDTIVDAFSKAEKRFSFTHKVETQELYACFSTKENAIETAQSLKALNSLKNVIEAFQSTKQTISGFVGFFNKKTIYAEMKQIIADAESFKINPNQALSELENLFLRGAFTGSKTDRDIFKDKSEAFYKALMPDEGSMIVTPNMLPEKHPLKMTITENGVSYAKFTFMIKEKTRDLYTELRGNKDKRQDNFVQISKLFLKNVPETEPKDEAKRGQEIAQNFSRRIFK